MARKRNKRKSKSSTINSNVIGHVGIESSSISGLKLTEPSTIKMDLIQIWQNSKKRKTGNSANSSFPKVRVHQMTTRSMTTNSDVGSIFHALPYQNSTTKKTKRPRPLQLYNNVDNQNGPTDEMKNVSTSGSKVKASPIDMLPVEILTNVLEYLNTKDLMSTRLVKKFQWNSVSTQILLKRECLKITLQYDSSSQCYLKSRSYIFVSSEGLNELSLCLDNSLSFPCTSFVLQCDGLFLKETKDFFRRHGRKINHLHLSLSSFESHSSHTPLKDIGKYLSLVPNIKSLYLLCPVQWKYENVKKLFTQRSRVTFPNLESIKIQDVNEFGHNNLTELLRAATNLKIFHDFNINSVNSFMMTHKISTVKHLHFDPRPSNITQYELFANNPDQKLMSIDISNCNPQVNVGLSLQSVTLTKILKANMDTLEKLSMSSFYDVGLYDVGFKWPILNKIKKVKVSFGWQSELPLFYPGFVFAVAFPNVSHVDMSMGYNSQWEQFLPSHHPPMNTVTKFIVHCVMDEERIEKLGMLFPNIKVLDLQKAHKFNELGKSVWKCFLRLECLKLTMHVFYTMGQGVAEESALDSVFTGLNDETCQMLRQNPSQSPRLNEQGEIIRDFPSIVALKELKRIDIRLSGSLVVRPDSSRRPFISDLSRRYAFELMEKFQKITVFTSASSTVDRLIVQEALGPVAPFIDINWW